MYEVYFYKGFFYTYLRFARSDSCNFFIAQIICVFIMSENYLETIASFLEVTCDDVIRYLQTSHWQVSVDHGAKHIINDITICMEDYLEAA